MTVYTLFNQAQTTTNTGLGGNLTVSTEFTMSETAALTGIWYYSPSGSTGLPTQCGIFQSGDTTAPVVSNTSPTWSGAAGSGWIKCTFDGSFTLTSGTTYLVAVFLGNSNVGGKQTVFWTTGPGASGFSNAAMSAPNYSTSSEQGAVNSGQTSLATAYPTTTENGSWYGPDVEVTVSSGGGTDSGTGGITLPAMKLAGSSTAPDSGTGSASVPAMKLSGSGTITSEGPYVVQSAVAGGGAGGVTLPSGITAGNSVVLFVSLDAYLAGYINYATNPTINGVAYSGEVVVCSEGITNGSGGDISLIALLLADIPASFAGGTAFSFSYTGGANVDPHFVSAYEVANLGTNPLVDVQSSDFAEAVASPGGTADSGTTSATSHYPAMAFGAATTYYGLGLESPGAQWTTLTNNVDNGNGSSGYQVLAEAGGTYNWSQAYPCDNPSQWIATVFTLYSGTQEASGNGSVKLPKMKPAGAQTNSLAVTATASNPADSLVLKVYAITSGVEAGGAGAPHLVYGTPSWALTPNHSNSRIVAGIFSASGASAPAITPGTNNATDDSGVASDGSPWWYGHYTGAVTAGTAVTVGGSDQNEWNASYAYEVIPSGGSTPAIDSSTPAAVVGTETSVTTAAFSPPAGAVLVAVLLSNNTAAPDFTISDNSGLGLTWTQRGTTEAAPYEGSAAVFTTTVPVNTSGSTSGAGSAKLPGMKLAGSGSEASSGAGGVKLPAMKLLGQTLTTSGAGSAKLPGMKLGASGTGKTTGTGSAKLPAMKLAGSGSGSTGSTGSVRLPAMKLAATGHESTSVTGGAKLPAMRLAGSGTAKLTGSGGLRLPAMRLLGSGPGLVSGTGAVRLPAMKLSGAGIESIHGSGGVRLPAMRLAGYGASGSSTVSVTVVVKASWNVTGGVSVILHSEWNVGQGVQQNMVQMATVPWISTYPS